MRSTIDAASQLPAGNCDPNVLSYFFNTKNILLAAGLYFYDGHS